MEHDWNLAQRPSEHNYYHYTTTASCQNPSLLQYSNSISTPLQIADLLYVV